MLQFSQQELEKQQENMEAAIRGTPSPDRKKIYQETLSKIKLALSEKKKQQTQPKHAPAPIATPTVVTFSKPTTQHNSTSSISSSDRNPNTDTYTVSVTDGARPRVKIIYPCSHEVILTEGKLRNRITRAVRDLENSKYYQEGGNLANLKLYRSCKAFYEGLLLINPDREFLSDNLIITRIKYEISTNSQQQHQNGE